MEFLLFTVILLLLGWGFGQWEETRHYQSIKTREATTAAQLTTTLENVPFDRPIQSVELATGSVVISIDYFKKFLAGFRMFFGGELRSYSSLIDRARREAVLRMKESCEDADLFINTRLETAPISRGANQKAIGYVEVVAYSTAIRFHA